MASTTTPPVTGRETACKCVALSHWRALP
jgi:hypothetical protein